MKRNLLSIRDRTSVEQKLVENSEKNRILLFCENNNGFVNGFLNRLGMSHGFA